MDIALRSRPATRLPIRAIVLLIVAALVTGLLGIAVVGSMNAVPSPYGLADNGLIAYSRDGDLWVRDGLGGDPRPLVVTDASDGFPGFSPDGRRLLYVSGVDERVDYWVADADGSDARQLLPDPILGDGQYAWAPDSRSIAVVNEVRGVPRLYIVSVETGAIATPDLGPLSVFEPAWRPGHPDTLLLHGEPGDGTSDLYTVQADGSNLHKLGLPYHPSSYGPGYSNAGGVWALDGETIAFTSVELDEASGVTHFRVRLVDPDGSNLRPVPGPSDPVVQEGWPTYSPDGAWILVHRWTWASNNGGEGWLAVLPADGSAPARDVGPRIPGGEATGLIKIWSPDGTRVLMRSDNTRQVFSIDPVTNETVELPWTDELPDWQRVTRWP